MKKTIRLAAPIQFESVVDGEGLRAVVWCQGCRVKCPGCHNPQTQDEEGGKDYYIQDLLTILDINSKHHEGITFSGGDPFLQPEQCKEIALYAKYTLGLNVWAYCGLTYEQLLEDPEKLNFLQICDVLVDGPFVKKLKDTSLKFRGSSNQRIIDVKKSLKENKVILWSK